MARIEFHGVVVPSDSAEAAWEPEETAMIREVIRPGMTALVAGGGFGWIASVVAATVGTDRVVVFEPQAALATILGHNVRIEGRPLRVRRLALSDTTGGGWLWEHPYWAAASLSRDREAHGRKIAVQTLALDQAVKMHGATALVLDIEGAEWAALRGLDWTPIQAAVVEVHESIIRRDGHEPGDIRAWMEGAGLRVVGEAVRADGLARWLAGTRGER
jgi:FkbM family methyltransferase